MPALIKSFIRSYFLATFENTPATRLAFWSLSTFLKPKSVLFDMFLDEFDFNLPPELIAQRPLKQKSRMLVFDGKITDANFSSFVDFLQDKDVLVFNDAKVIKAKLHGWRGEAKVEFNLDQAVENGYWRAICKGSRKIKQGDMVDFGEDFGAEIIEKFDDGFCILRFFGGDLEENLQKYGKTPLPPYIKHDPTKEDDEDYQTIYAKNGSAVAAPTAGLHFDDEIFAKIAKKGVKTAFVTLNVGAGTFLPVRSEKITDHKMHEEYFEISQEMADKINQARRNGGRVIAVGTTSLRVLESCADENGVVVAKKMKTDIFIYPGYEFRAIDGLLTNFHLPKSTLFMLICAVIGRENAFGVYQHAIAQKYRFFSYGDCCLFL